MIQTLYIALTIAIIVQGVLIDFDFINRINILFKRRFQYINICQACVSFWIGFGTSFFYVGESMLDNLALPLFSYLIGKILTKHFNGQA